MPRDVLLLGLGTMTAHSTMLTLATEFARKARGAAMSLVAFAFMVGGAIGTAAGGRIIGQTSYDTMFVGFAVGIAVLAGVALPALAAAAAVQPGELATDAG